VLRKFVITLEADLAEWVRKWAAEEDIPVSKLIARLLEREKHAADRYLSACGRWKKRDRNLGVGIDASKRFTRDEAHER
jgi:hypothetical protein